jgi:hypothetical protein
MEYVLDQFPDYHIKIFWGNASVKVERQAILKLTVDK